jgi:DNA-binding beta-propeller fold protein YncE
LGAYELSRPPRIDARAARASASFLPSFSTLFTPKRIRIMSHQMPSITVAVLGLVALGTITPLARADFLYVSRDDNTITRIDTTTKAETIFATTGLDRPTGLAFDATGNLYAANYDSGTIERFTPGGVGTTFATGLNGPEGLAIDGAGNVYATSGNTIERFTPGGVASVFASTGLNQPQGLAFDAAGNLYAANQGSNTIEKFTPGGIGSVLATSNAVTNLSGPQGLAFDAAGNLYAANEAPSFIEQIAPNGIGSTFATNELSNPVGLAFDEARHPRVARDLSVQIRAARTVFFHRLLDTAGRLDAVLDCSYLRDCGCPDFFGCHE